MYSFTSKVRFSEVDPERNLTFGSLIDYFQDCCTFQSEELGIGIDFLAPQNRVWLLSAWQVVIHRLPKLGEQIVVNTWPHAFSGFMGDRNFTLQDADGQLLAVANSLWVFADIETGRPAKLTPEYISLYKTEPAYPMEYAPRKIALPQEYSVEESFLITKAYLDYNHHVNNGQYIRMAESFLPADFPVGELRADYRTSALLQDEIFPLVHCEKNMCTIVLANADHKPYATIQFIRKK